MTELSARQNEVYRLIAEGLSNKAIAARLSLSEGTVRVHVRDVFRKLKVHRRTELIVKAFREGVIA